MTRLNELINEFCPDGVEYKTLGEVATIFRGGNFQKKDFVEEGKPCIHYGQLYTHFKNSTDKTITFVSEEIFKKSKHAQPNDIVMAVTSENIEDVCSCVAWLGKENIAVSGHTAIIHHNQNPKYMSYFFHSESFFSQKIKLAHGTKVIEVTPDKLMNIKIPVPPLPVQEEIVRILDKFTSLEAELEAELEARRVQYEYYRDELLTRETKVQVKTLGEVAKIKNGKDYKHLSEGKYPVYGSGGIMTYVNDFCYDKPSVLIPRKGSINNLFYVDEPFWNVDTVFYTEINEKIITPKYFYYLLKKEHLEKLNTAGGVPSLTQSVLNKVILSIPPLEIQQRIVNVLDNFDAICSDLKIGLPAEIEARKKQYEYYRDLLLTFAERGNTILTEQNRTEQNRTEQMK